MLASTVESINPQHVPTACTMALFFVRRLRPSKPTSHTLTDVVPGGEAYSTDTIRAEALRQQERAQQRQAEKKDSAKEKLLQHAQREKEKLQELLQLAKATRREGALYQG